MVLVIFKEKILFDSAFGIFFKRGEKLKSMLLILQETQFFLSKKNISFHLS